MAYLISSRLKKYRLLKLHDLDELKYLKHDQGKAVFGLMQTSNVFFSRILMYNVFMYLNIIKII